MTHEECLCKDLFKLVTPLTVKKSDVDNLHDAIVVALCKNYSYERSELNTTLYEASAEIVGYEAANVYIHEIGNKINFHDSKVLCSAPSYKKKKREIMDNIRKRLYLSER